MRTGSGVGCRAPQDAAASRVVDFCRRRCCCAADAVNKSPSVKRLVLTSSYYAVTADAGDREKGHVFKEDEWNETSSESINPYA